MAHRLDRPNQWGGTTDHSNEIRRMRAIAKVIHDDHMKVSYNLAADLLEAHDQTGISLDDWPWARRFVESILGAPIIPNLV